MEKQYAQFITELKYNIIQNKYRAVQAANKFQLLLYLNTGRALNEKMISNKWGEKVLQQIEKDLQKELPGLKGFSYRNLRNMRTFYLEYQDILAWSTLTDNLSIGDPEIWQTLSAKINPEQERGFYSISFSHHLLIINKCKSQKERWFYITHCANLFWSYRVLEHHLLSNFYKHQGKIPTNFETALPTKIKAAALEVFKDNYLFDFVSLSDGDGENVLESQIVANIKDSIMALGRGFCFIGNQYRIEVGGELFFIDLLFYNRLLNCLVAFELKRVDFKPEFAGKLNFYLVALDRFVKLPSENPSIGIILCKAKNDIVVEFSFQGLSSPLGAATYKTSKEVPEEMRGILPSAKELADFL